MKTYKCQCGTTVFERDDEPFDISLLKHRVFDLEKDIKKVLLRNQQLEDSQKLHTL